jgi:hypothetical protein
MRQVERRDDRVLLAQRGVRDRCEKGLGVTYEKTLKIRFTRHINPARSVNL